MTRSYWHIKNKAPLKTGRNIQIPKRVDIAIIGGGIVGMATAHYLRSMNCLDVIVLEKEFVGYGASGRNAGFLLSGLAEPYSRLVVGLGRDSAKMLMQATIDNHDLVADTVSRLKINCDYRRTGSFHLAVSAVESEELRESVKLLCRDGFAGEYVGSQDIGKRLGFGNYSGGFFNPIDGNLDPYAFVKGLSENTRVVEGFEVKEIRKNGGRLKLNSEGYSLEAEMVVLATNAYSPLLDGFFDRLIFPVRGQMIAAGPGLSCRLNDQTYYANFGYDYFRRTPDNFILMGGLRNRFVETEVGFDDSTNPLLQDGLEDYIRTKIGVEKFPVVARWSGVMGNTIDGLPLVGPLPHNGAVIAAVGCNGHGFGLGMIEARDVATALLKGETSDLLRRFSIKRFAF